MTKVAKINQGLETTFVDLENADEDSIISAFRPNTKVRAECLFLLRNIPSDLVSLFLAHLDRDPNESYAPSN